MILMSLGWRLAGGQCPCCEHLCSAGQRSPSNQPHLPFPHHHFHPRLLVSHMTQVPSMSLLQEAPPTAHASTARNVLPHLSGTSLISHSSLGIPFPATAEKANPPSSLVLQGPRMPHILLVAQCITSVSLWYPPIGPSKQAVSCVSL